MNRIRCEHFPHAQGHSALSVVQPLKVTLTSEASTRIAKENNSAAFIYIRSRDPFHNFDSYLLRMLKYYSLQTKQKLFLESGKDKEIKGIADYSSSSLCFWAILWTQNPAETQVLTGNSMIFACSVCAPFHILKLSPDYNAKHRANVMSMAATLLALGMTGKSLHRSVHSGVSAQFSS